MSQKLKVVTIGGGSSYTPELLEGFLGRDADLVVMVDCQIPSDDLIVHFF